MSGYSSLSYIWQFSKYTRQMSDVRHDMNATRQKKNTAIMIKQVFKWIKNEPKHTDTQSPKEHIGSSKERYGTGK